MCGLGVATFSFLSRAKAPLGANGLYLPPTDENSAGIKKIDAKRIYTTSHPALARSLLSERTGSDDDSTFSDPIHVLLRLRVSDSAVRGRIHGRDSMVQCQKFRIDSVRYSILYC